MKLEEGDVVCSKCHGSGKEKDKFICSKCYGRGKVDWITNAINTPYPISTLNQLNVRRMLVYVRNTIEKALEENIGDKNIMKTTTKSISGHLTNMQQNKLICDWRIVSHSDKDISVFLKPVKALDVIRLNFKVI